MKKVRNIGALLKKKHYFKKECACFSFSGVEWTGSKKDAECKVSSHDRYYPFSDQWDFPYSYIL